MLKIFIYFSIFPIISYISIIFQNFLLFFYIPVIFYISYYFSIFLIFSLFLLFSIFPIIFYIPIIFLYFLIFFYIPIILCISYNFSIFLLFFDLSYYFAIFLLFFNISYYFLYSYYFSILLVSGQCLHANCPVFDFFSAFITVFSCFCSVSIHCFLNVTTSRIMSDFKVPLCHVSLCVFVSI